MPPVMRTGGIRIFGDLFGPEECSSGPFHRRHRARPASHGWAGDHTRRGRVADSAAAAADLRGPRAAGPGDVGVCRGLL